MAVSLILGYVTWLQNTAPCQCWHCRGMRGAVAKDLGPCVLHGWPSWWPGP